MTLVVLGSLLPWCHFWCQVDVRTLGRVHEMGVLTMATLGKQMLGKHFHVRENKSDFKYSDIHIIFIQD